MLQSPSAAVILAGPRRLSAVDSTARWEAPCHSGNAGESATRTLPSHLEGVEGHHHILWLEEGKNCYDIRKPAMRRSLPKLNPNTNLNLNRGPRAIYSLLGGPATVTLRSSPQPHPQRQPQRQPQPQSRPFRSCAISSLIGRGRHCNSEIFIATSTSTSTSTSTADFRSIRYSAGPPL